MTVEEYLEHKNYPTGEIVFLKDKDYVAGVNFLINKNNYHTSIFINNIPELAGIEFILINGKGHLFIMDDYRNPRQLTPFYIKRLKIKKL